MKNVGKWKELVYKYWIIVLLVLVAAFLSPSITDIWPNSQLHLWVKVILTAVVFAFTLESVLTHRAWHDALESKGGVTTRGLLLQQAARRSCVLLREFREAIISIRSRNESHDRVKARKNLIDGVLQSICEMFENDQTGAQHDSLATTYFKVTLFEYDKTIGQSGGVKRCYYFYPAFLQPQTPSIDFQQKPHAGATQCFNERKIIVFENIDESMRNGEWEEVRINQFKDYQGGSMICIPLWNEQNRESALRGVVTLDTNRPRYFRNTNAAKEFISEILDPYIELIRAIYSLTD